MTAWENARDYYFTDPGAFLLDTYPNAAFAYSLRRLRSDYTGPACRIRNTVYNTENDFYFDINGDFPATAVAQWLAPFAGSGFIVKWYDQSVNERHVIQATSSSQPLYVASAGGLMNFPSMQADGSDDVLATASAVDAGLITQGTIFAVMNHDSSAGNNTLFSWSTGGILNCHPPFGGVIYFDLGSTAVTGRISVSAPTGSPGGFDDNPHILELYRDSGDNQAITVDGINLTSSGGVTDDNTGFTSTWNVFQHYSGAGFNYKGLCNELVGWATDLGSTDRAAARNAINAYYGIF